MQKTPLVGLGYRRPLHGHIARHVDAVEFLEVISDHYLAAADISPDLDDLRDQVPLVLHGVGLSPGTATGFDEDYVAALGNLARRSGARWCSDHLSFSRVPEIDTGDLLPLWFSERSLDVVCRNLSRVQDALPVPFLVENITYYFSAPGEISEAEFIGEVLAQTGCGLLLDVNNLFINSVNHGYDPYAFLDRIPLERIMQIHVAGGLEVDGVLIDTHSSPASGEVLSLLGHVLRRVTPGGISVEWDHDFPNFDVLLGELAAIRDVVNALPAAVGVR